MAVVSLEWSSVLACPSAAPLAVARPPCGCRICRSPCPPSGSGPIDGYGLRLFPCGVSCGVFAAILAHVSNFCLDAIALLRPSRGFDIRAAIFL